MSIASRIYDLSHDSSERALIYARAAGDALVVVDSRSLVLVHGDGFDLAGVLAGTFAVDNGGVGADLSARSALNALCFVDVSNVVLVKGNGSAPAYVLTAVGKTAAAGVCNFVSAHRTFVAGDFDNLDNIGVSPYLRP